MAVEERTSWLSYLTFGRLGRNQERAVIPAFATESSGPGLYRIHEPVNAAVE